MKEMIKMVLVLSLFCGLSGLTLATVKQSTSKRIEEQVLIFVQGPALEQIFKDHDNNPVNDRKTFELDGRELTVFPFMQNGKLACVAFETFGEGYGGPVGIMVGFATDGDSLKGIGITTLKETPGLGARLVEAEYRDQFRDLSTEGIALDKQGGSIRAIAGATISSTASVTAINEAVQLFKKLKPRINETWGS